MTYLESYRKCKTVEEIKRKVVLDTKVAIFFGANPDRIKAIEDAMNQAIAERKDELFEFCPNCGARMDKAKPKE
jgi:hypothetical protein